jgi:hypothetical protein
MRFISGLAATATVVAAGFVAAVPATAATVASYPAVSHRAAAPAAAGAQLWAETLSKKGKEADSSATAVSPDGSTVYVTGGTVGAGPVGKGVTVAYNATTGRKLWEAVYTSAGNEPSFWAVTVSPDSPTVYVNGGIIRPKGANEELVVAYNAVTGAMLWQHTEPGLGVSGENQVVVAPDGSALYITGMTHTEALNTSTGTVEWNVKNPDNSNNSQLVVSPDGSTVYTAGNGSGNLITATVASFDAATGATNWRYGYSAPAGSEGEFGNLSISPDGSTVYASGTLNLQHGNRFLEVSLNAVTGAQNWANSTQAVTVSSDIQDMAADSSAVFLTEYIADKSDSYIGYEETVALDPATGATLWQAKYADSTGSKKADSVTPQAMEISPDSSAVYVTGEATKEVSGRVHIDLVTLAYSTSTGTSLWKAVTAQEFSNVADGIAVSPHGSAVYVSAWIEPKTGLQSFFTVAYSTS